MCTRQAAQQWVYCRQTHRFRYLDRQGQQSMHTISLGKLATSERDNVMRWIFFKFKHFNQYFLGMRWRFWKSFKSFSLPYTIINFLFFKMLNETLFKISFSVIGRCSVVPTSHWLQGKCAWTSLSQVDSGMILEKHSRLLFIFKVKIAALGSLRRGYWKVFQN